jgi:hypothetical protein
MAGISAITWFHIGDDWSMQSRVMHFYTISKAIFLSPQINEDQ